jgi:hypothetical protein
MRQHTAAIKAMISAHPALAGKVFVTLAKGDQNPLPLPYVVIHPAAGTDESDRLTGPKIVFYPRFTIHSVGSDAEQAAATGEAVKSRLISGGFGLIPVVAGELPRMVWYSSPVPIQVDYDVSPPLCFHVAECGFESSPA